MKTMLIDAQAREQALDPAQSFIVQAPAGAGKTGLLIRRILVLLTVVEKPEEILAITFTKKATAEMRERVIEALHKAHNKATFDAHEQDVKALALKVLIRDKDKNWQLLTQTHRLKIQTIDALCTDLIRKMPWSARFGGMPNIQTEVDHLYHEAAQRLIERIDSAQNKPDKLADALQRLLMDAGGKVTPFREQLKKMLHSRENWLGLIFKHEALKSREKINAQWQTLIIRALDQLDNEFDDSLFQALLALTRYAQENLPDNKPSDLSDDNLKALYDNSRKPDANVREAQWRAIIALICTQKGFKAGLGKATGFPSDNAEKKQLKSILNDLQDNQPAFEAIQLLRSCPDAQLSDAEWQRIKAVKLVLPALAQELHLLMNEQNCSDFSELPVRAISALGGFDQPTDLALIQDYQLKHLLMDEFQDTSPIQLSLLEQLIETWQSGDGRSLFFVGDPMQSIYRFRNADVRVFLQVREHGINQIKPVPLQLKVNFRSSPDIITWVNQSMAEIFPKHDSPDEGEVAYNKSFAHHAFSGKVHHHLCVSQNAQDETNQVLRVIKAIQVKDTHADIGVLARKRVPLARLAASLDEAKIAFEGVELQTLIDHLIIQDLISLCGTLIQPHDALAWLAVLRAPWCGLSLADLTRLRKTKLPLHKAIEHKEILATLSTRGQNKLRRFCDAKLRTQEACQALTFPERVQALWFALRGPACYEAHQNAYAQAFFDLLQQLETDAPAISRARLITACEKHKTSSMTGSLKLMTLHKAKGLEFDHVILLELAGKPGGDNRTQPLLSSFCQQNNQGCLIASASVNDEKNSKSAYLKQIEKTQEKNEAARLLYVAVTRAKKCLHLSARLNSTKEGEPGKATEGSLLQLLWEHSEEAFLDSAQFLETAMPASNDDETKQSRGVLLSSLPDDLNPIDYALNIEFSPNNPSKQTEALVYDWAKEDAKIIGLAVHQTLEYCDLTTLKNWQQPSEMDLQALGKKLSQFGLAKTRLDEATDKAKKTLQTMANDPRAYWLFDPAHQDQHAEWALSSHFSGKVIPNIIDRSFIDSDDVRWIIDFKTSSHQGSDIKAFLDEQEKRHADQLNRYAALLSALAPQRKIKLGLYFPALGKWRERDYSG